MGGAIKTFRLTKDYGDNKGIFNVTFQIESGEVFGFLGPNGSGKTTTIRHLLGFSAPDSGMCAILGMNCRQDADVIHKHLGYLPGEMALFEEMTGIEFLRFMARMRKMDNFSKAERLLARFDLDPSGRIKKMSKGMKQKVGLVCAFMHDPQVLILDEPTSGLDPLMQDIFVQLILEEKKQGKTVLMSSHSFGEVERTCDRIGIIKQGRLIADESIHTIRQSQQKAYSITFADPNEAVHFAKDSQHILSLEGSSVQITVPGSVDPLIKRLGAYQITSFDVVHQSLEDLFKHYYGGEGDD
ncbi:MAG: ATP-binding cassette domain-containing protein [Bacillus sp. (in: firmicutes)]